ncbi:hypothetical protein K439DRAFT_1613398 [Ramaria rubella]|nr:hypothetical protein K439DRAFT_1613398 [Ramaria rubella]
MNSRRSFYREYKRDKGIRQKNRRYKVTVRPKNGVTWSIIPWINGGWVRRVTIYYPDSHNYTLVPVPTVNSVTVNVHHLPSLIPVVRDFHVTYDHSITSSLFKVQDEVLEGHQDCVDGDYFKDNEDMLLGYYDTLVVLSLLL